MNSFLSKKTLLIFCFLGAILIIVVTLIASGKLSAPKNLSQKNIGLISKITPMLGDSKPDLSKPQTYSNPKLGLAFTHPGNWQISEVVLKRGEKHEEAGLITTSTGADTTLIKLNRENNWLIWLEVQKEFSIDSCAGTVSSTWKTGFPTTFTKIQALGREALRGNIEKGSSPSIGTTQQDPHPVPIYFRRLQGELPQLGSETEAPFALKYCFESPEKKTKVKITYYSKDFSNKNILEEKINTAVLLEMDQILSSLKLQ
ncbi:MAG: hypothetical protein Q7S88_02985 [Candidatus Daviesbacteria bacterium]|nr:hypothetical protein [Candidatus Daviesbacteria bacterium]